MPQLRFNQFLPIVVFAFTGAACSREQPAADTSANSARTTAQSNAVDLDSNAVPPDPRTRNWIADNSLRFNPAKVDDSTLASIASDIDNKRVVFLGETNHGVAEFAQVKLSLVRTLHESLGFNVLAWDGPIWECSPLRSSAGSYRADSLLKYCAANSGWSTEEVRAVFQYVESTQRTSRPLVLVGLVPTRLRADITPEQLNAFATLINPYDAPLAERIRARTAQLTRSLLGVGDAKERISPVTIAPLLDTVSTTLARLGERAGLSEVDHARLTLAATSARTGAFALRRMYTSSRPRNAGDLRSSISHQKAMAENLAYVVDTLYPAQKAIVWTTNSQARRAAANGFVVGQHVGMAGLFASLMPNHSVFSFGIYPASGSAMSYRTKSMSLATPARNTLEEMLCDAAGRATYVRTSGQPETPGTWWLRSPIVSSFEGERWKPLRLNDEYDAVVVVAKATPSHFWNTDYSLR